MTVSLIRFNLNLRNQNKSYKYFSSFCYVGGLMNIPENLLNVKKEVIEKAKKIKLVLTDNDGVLTDSGVYFSKNGEEFKKFSIRDGMGVERLRVLLNIETGIITGEKSGAVQKRAEKLLITETHLSVKEKHLLLPQILEKKQLKSENVAFIGDDVNDVEIMKLVALTASPNDAFYQVKNGVDYVCKANGGNGAFREFAELIISSQII